MKTSITLSLFLLAVSFLFTVPNANAEEGVYPGIGSDRNIAKISSFRYLPLADEALTIGADKCIRLWDVSNWKKLDEFRFHMGLGRIGEIRSLAVTKDETRFAVGRFGAPSISFGDIFIVQKSPKKILHRLQQHTSSVTQLAFYDNDTKLLSIDESGLLLTWDLQTGQSIGKVSFGAAKETIFSAAVNEQNQVVLGTSLGRLHVLSLTPSLKLLHSQPAAHPNKRVKGVFWTDDRELISIGDGGNLKRWRWDSASLMLTNQKSLGDKSNLQSLTLDRQGGKFFAFFGANENLAEAGKTEIACRVFDFELTEQNRLTAFDNSDRLVQSAQFVPTRNELIVNLASSTLETWDLNTNELRGAFANESKDLFNVKIDQGHLDSAEAFQVLWRDKQNFQLDKNAVPLTHGFDLVQRSLFTPADSQKIQDENYVVKNFSIGRNPADPKMMALLGNSSGAMKPIAAPFSIQDNRHGTLVREAALIAENVAVVGTDDGLFLFEPQRGTEIKRLDHQSKDIDSISFTRDHRFFTTYSVFDRSTAIWSIGDDPTNPQLMAKLFVVGDEWALVSPEGYFDCTPAAEKFFGWHVNVGLTEFATFHQLDRFRDKFHTPALFELLWFNANLSRSLKTLQIVQQSISQNIGPNIALVTPEMSTIEQKSPDIIKVAVEFSAKGSERPKAVSLLINDRPHDRYYHEIEPGETSHEFDVKLAQGKQEISAKVYSASRKSSISSRQVEVNFRPYGSQQKPQGKLFFLGIGIDEFEHYSKLDFCRSDVKTIGEVFRSGSQGAFNEAAEVSLPAITTKDQFKTELKKLLSTESGENEFNQTDTLVVMWSGHGDVDNSNNFYLCLPGCQEPTFKDDSSLRNDGISAIEIAQELRNINGGHIVLILDTCYAGKAVEQFRDSAGNLAREAGEDEYGIMVISATGATETSKENRELGMSNFAFLLRTGLLGEKIFSVGSKRRTAISNPLVELDGMNIVTTHSLVEFLKNEMPEINSTQTINTNGFGSRVKFLASR